MAKEYTKHDEELKKMIINLWETCKDKTRSVLSLQLTLRIN